MPLRCRGIPGGTATYYEPPDLTLYKEVLVPLTEWVRFVSVAELTQAVRDHRTWSRLEKYLAGSLIAWRTWGSIVEEGETLRADLSGLQALIERLEANLADPSYGRRRRGDEMFTLRELCRLYVQEYRELLDEGLSSFLGD
jgi:hypothetical protein